MAIRFVNDAAAVVIPPNQSSRKYGQQLVQQQQKYANDQRQLQQENMYDRQKEYRQTAFQLQKAQTDRFVDAQRIKDQQAFAEKMQQNALDAQDKRAQQEMQLRARQQEQQRIEQLKKQQQMDDFDGINSGEFDPKVASRMKELWRRKNEIPMDKNLDEGMRAEESDKIEEELSGLRGNRIQAPSGAERANRNLSHYVPSLQKYATPEELQELRKADPNIEVQVFQDGKMLPGPTPKQGPMTARDYYRADDAKFNKDLSSKMSELQDKLDAGEMTPLEEGQDLRSVAWQQMQDDYDFKQKALGGGQPAQGGQPAMPPQAGQPAMPPAQAPAAQPPEMGMQDIEPTYNADGTTSAPGQPAMPPQAGQPLMPPINQSEQPAAPAQAGQPASQPELIYNDGIGGNGKVYERMPDGSVREFKDAAKQPIQQADGSMWQQSPEDGAWRVVPPTIQPFRPEQPAMPPARPLQPGEEEGGSSFAPRAPGVQQQPTEALPIDQSGMQPPQQNVWAELAAPEQKLPEQKAADATTIAKPPIEPIAAPDFAKLASSATDDADRVVFSNLQGIYDKQPPDVQSAISVIVDAGSDPKLAAKAYLYLKNKGVDIAQLTKTKTKKRQLPGMSGIR